MRSLQPAVHAHDLAAGPEEGLPLGREGEGAPATVDQTDLKALLQRPNLLGDGALRNAVGRGGLGKAAALREIAKNLECLNLHP